MVVYYYGKLDKASVSPTSPKESIIVCPKSKVTVYLLILAHFFMICFQQAEVA